jgi:hypothetical protein
MPTAMTEKLYKEHVSPNGRWIFGFILVDVREGCIARPIVLEPVKREVVFELGDSWDASGPEWNEDRLTTYLRETVRIFV